MKNIKIFADENFPFLKLKKSLFIAWASFRNASLRWKMEDDVHVTLLPIHATFADLGEKKNPL